MKEEILLCLFVHLFAFSSTICPHKSLEVSLILTIPCGFENGESAMAELKLWTFKQRFLIIGRMITDFLSVSILLITHIQLSLKEMNSKINLEAHYVSIKLVKIRSNGKT